MKRNKIFAIGILCLLLALSACGQEPAKESTAPETHTAHPIGYPTVPPTAEIPQETGTDPAASTAADPAETTGEVPPVTEPEATKPPVTDVPTSEAVPESSEVPPETTEIPPETTEIPPETKPADQIIRYDDGSQIVRRFDEEGRQIEESFYYADGRLNYTDQKEFYPDGTVKREYYEERLRDGTGKCTELLYYENGGLKYDRRTKTDGSEYICEYDELGRGTAQTGTYPNGQKQVEYAWTYYGDTDDVAESLKKEWREDGSLSYSNEEAYREDGSQKSLDRTYDDGTRWVKETRADGRTEREEYYRAGGQMSSKHEYYYDENGVLLGDTYEEWLEDGSLNRCWTGSFYPNGTQKTRREIYSWDRDTEFYYEYDEQGHTLLEERKALDDSIYSRNEWEYYPGTGNWSKKVRILRTAEGQSESTALYREDGSLLEVTEKDEDGSHRIKNYDEKNRVSRREEYNADDFLVFVEEQSFYGDSHSDYSRYYYEEWSEELNDYIWSETLYEEDSAATKMTGKRYDGWTYYIESNGNGDSTFSEHWYPNGQMHSRSETHYYEDTGWRSFYSERDWEEDGSGERYTEEYFYPDGKSKSYSSQEGDSALYWAYNEQGMRTVYEERNKNNLTYQQLWTYAEDGETKLEYHQKRWSEEGKLSWRDEIYYPDGVMQSLHYGSEDGWDEQREYREDGTCTLEISINPAGTKVYEYVLHENDSYVIREWHDNGLLKIYQKHDTAAGTDVYEQYLDDSTPYIRNIDGPGEFKDHRIYDTSIGMVRFQTLVKEGIYHERYYEEGRMIVDRRYTALPDGGYDTYLGDTVWEYFEDGGVKKIRISESNEKGTMISQIVVTDDGKTGYPD